MIGVILLKSRIGANPIILRKLDLLKLKRKHNLFFVEDNKLNIIKKLGAYVIYGVLTAEQAKTFIDNPILLQSPRGGYDKITKKVKGKRILGLKQNIFEIIGLMRHERGV